MKNKSTAARLVVAVLLAGASGTMGWRIVNRPRPPEVVSVSAIRQQNGTPVTVWPVSGVAWEYWLPLYGTVRTSGLSEVYASESEYVTALLAEVGDFVKKGQTLATLDSRQAAEKVQAAGARFDELSMKYGRVRELQKAGGSSRQEVETLYSQYKEAASSLQQLKTDLARHKVASPIEGLVMRRDAEIGLLAGPGRVLFVIGDPKRFEIEIGLSPRYIRNVKNGSPARFLNSDGAWEDAAVKRVDPMANATTGLYSVVLAVDSTRLNVGASVEARVRIEYEPNTIVVPYESVREVEGVARVYLSSGDVAVERVVKKGRTDEQGRTRILSGLDGGESVVLKGADRMYDGARIWIQES